jgi:hypothetical protein
MKIKKKFEWSKLMTLLVVLAGFIIAQETLVLMYYCIKNDYTSTAAWLTAAVGLAEIIIGTGLTGYLNLVKSDHKEGGITFESARAKNFKHDDCGGNDNSPAI